MASNAAVPFWRAAGMTYITYSNLCANLVRNCLKEPRRTEALSREKVHFSVSKWVDGKAEKPSNFSNPMALFSFLSLFQLLMSQDDLDLEFHVQVNISYFSLNQMLLWSVSVIFVFILVLFGVKFDNLVGFWYN